MKASKISLLIFAPILLLISSGTKNQSKIHEVTSFQDLSMKLNTSGKKLAVINFCSTDHSVFALYCVEFAPKLEYLFKQYQKVVF